jgi:hypothetical protein
MALTDFAASLQKDAEGEKQQISQEIAEQKATTEAGKTALEARLAERTPEYEELKYRQAQLDTIPTPKLAPPPPAPSTQEMIKPTSLQRQFGIASIFALLSVGLAKGSAIYGLKGLAGFMEGAHAGNLEQAKAAIDDFNNNMKSVHEANENALAEYNAIFNNKKLGFEAQERAFKLKALEFSDQLALQQYEQSGLTAVHKLNQDRANVDKAMHTELLRNEQIKMQMEHYERMAGIAEKKATAASGGVDMSSVPLGPIDPTTGRREEFLKQFTPADQELIKAMANGQMAASGFGNIDQKRRTFLVQAAQLYDPNFNARKFQIGSYTAKEFSPAGQAGQNIIAINTMVHHLEDYVESFKKLNNTQIQQWNKAKNKAATEFGDPALQVVKQAGLRVAGEYAKLIKGGRAAPTDQEMAHWEEVFTSAMSPRQMQATAWDALKGAGGRIAALQDAYAANLPGEKLDAITPAAKSIILKYKPKDEPMPDWLDVGGGLPKVGDVKAEIERQNAEFRRLGVDPKTQVARNPQTGEVKIFKDGQWQTFKPPTQ